MANTTTTNGHGDSAVRESQMLFNTDSVLWLNYGHSMSKQSPQEFVSLTIHPEGDLSNGREHLARFASRKDAVLCLIGAGWDIDGDIARFTYPA